MYNVMQMKYLPIWFD